MKNCYDAISDDGKVIVLEALLPIIPENGYASKSTSQLDVLMMTQNPGGKERSRQEFEDLATRVGFSGIRYECCVRNFWVMEFFKWRVLLLLYESQVVVLLVCYTTIIIFHCVFFFNNHSMCCICWKIKYVQIIYAQCYENLTQKE